MDLAVTTDPHEIAAQLERLLAIDPVRSTILGTIVVDLRDGRAPGCWSVTVPGTELLVVRSAPVYPALFTAGWTGDALAAAVELVVALPNLIAVTGPVEVADAAAALTGRRLRERIGIRLFRLDDLTPPLGVPGAVRRADTGDRALIVQWYKAFQAEAGGFGSDLEAAADNALRTGVVWLWVDGDRPVSLAARRAAEAGSARIGPVYTPPAERGRGYGSAVTAAATRDILDLGAIPVLFTDLANQTSNSIYQAIGYYAVEDRAMITLD